MICCAGVGALWNGGWLAVASFCQERGGGGRRLLAFCGRLCGGMLMVGRRGRIGDLARHWRAEWMGAWIRMCLDLHSGFRALRSRRERSKGLSLAVFAFAWAGACCGLETGRGSRSRRGRRHDCCWGLIGARRGGGRLKLRELRWMLGRLRFVFRRPLGVLRSRRGRRWRRLRRIVSKTGGC